MNGAVLVGAYQGRPLERCAPAEADALLARIRRDDPEGASLLEAYLDRRLAGWRQAQARVRPAAGDAAATR